MQKKWCVANAPTRLCGWNSKKMKRYDIVTILYFLLFCLYLSSCNQRQLSGLDITNTAVIKDTLTPNLSTTLASTPTEKWTPSSAPLPVITMTNTPTQSSTNSYEPPIATIQEYCPSEPLGHENYRFVDIAMGTEFKEQHANAIKNDESWVSDPIEVGLRFAGYPNVDLTNPDKVFVYYLQSNKVVMVVLAEGLMDDATQSEEIRVDLEKEGNIWFISWAGIRQKCYRSEFEGWVTGPCP